MTPWGRTDKTPGAFNRPERLHASCLLQSPGGSGQGRQDKCLRAHIQMLWLEAALLKLEKKKKKPYLLTSMLLSTQICKHPQAGSANFWKGADSKDFRLCRPHSFCCNYRICQRMEKRQLLLSLRVPSLGLDTAPGHCLRGSTEAWANTTLLWAISSPHHGAPCGFPQKSPGRKSPEPHILKLHSDVNPAPTQQLSLVGDSFQERPEDGLRQRLLVGAFFPLPSGLGADVLGMQAVDEDGLQGAAHTVGISVFARDHRVRGHVLLLQRFHGAY